MLKKNNPFGDKGYKMKDSYLAKDLVVGNLELLSSEAHDFGPMVQTTNQKYIFEVIPDKEKYREIFTGFVAGIKEEYFDLPYATNIKPFTSFFDDMSDNDELPKLSLLLYLNDVNSKKMKKENQFTK